MENAEEIQLVLERYSRVKPKEIPEELDEYLTFVAKTGDTVFKWPLIQYLFREKLLSVITEFHNTTPSIAEIPHYPNVDPFNYDLMKKMLIERMESFPSAPFTIQRICELLTEPRKQYSRIDKFMRAIEKNILVVSTLEPGRRRHESENGESMDSTINGDLLGDGHVDVGGGDEHNDIPLEAAVESNLTTELNKDDESGTSSDHSEEIEVPLEKLEPEVNVLTVDPLSTEDTESKPTEEVTITEEKVSETSEEQQLDEEIKQTTQDDTNETETVQDDSKQDEITVNDVVDTKTNEDQDHYLNNKEDESTPTEEKTTETIQETILPEEELKEDEAIPDDLPNISNETVEQPAEEPKEVTEEKVLTDQNVEKENTTAEEQPETDTANATNSVASEPVEETKQTDEVNIPSEPPIEQSFVNSEPIETNPVDVVDMETDPQPTEDQKVVDGIAFDSTQEFTPQEPANIIITDVIEMETDQQHVEETAPTNASIPFEPSSEQMFGKQEQTQEATNDVVDMETADTQVNNADPKNEMMQGFL